MCKNIDGRHVWRNRRAFLQDAQKASLLTRPTPARQDAPCPKQGRSSATDPRFTFHASRFTDPGSDARTLLADFFSILLEGLGRCPAKTIWGGANALCPFRAHPRFHIVMSHA
jgi:hypothetical protein